MATRLYATPVSFATFLAIGPLRHLRLPPAAGRGAVAAAAAAAEVVGARSNLRRAPSRRRAAPLGGASLPFTRLPLPTPAGVAAARASPSGRVRMLAAPRKTLPKHTVRVYCAGCRALLYKYHKGGTGSLVKMYLERIAQDETTEPGVCGCGVTVARPATIHGRPALKVVGGKVYVRG